MPSIDWSQPYSGPHASLCVNDAELVARRHDVQFKTDDLIAAMRLLSDDERTDVYQYLSMHFCKDCGGSQEDMPWGYLRHCSCTRED